MSARRTFRTLCDWTQFLGLLVALAAIVVAFLAFVDESPYVGAGFLLGGIAFGLLVSFLAWAGRALLATTEVER